MKRSLLEFPNDQLIKIVELNCDFDFRRRLCALGVYAGAIVEISKNDNFSPVILKVFNSKVALSRAESQKIFAVELNEIDGEKI